MGVAEAQKGMRWRRGLQGLGGQHLRPLSRWCKVREKAKPHPTPQLAVTIVSRGKEVGGRIR